MQNRSRKRWRMDHTDGAHFFSLCPIRSCSSPLLLKVQPLISASRSKCSFLFPPSPFHNKNTNFNIKYIPLSAMDRQRAEIHMVVDHLFPQIRSSPYRKSGWWLEQFRISHQNVDWHVASFPRSKGTLKAHEATSFCSAPGWQETIRELFVAALENCGL